MGVVPKPIMDGVFFPDYLILLEFWLEYFNFRAVPLVLCDLFGLWGDSLYVDNLLFSSFEVIRNLNLIGNYI